MGLGDKIIATLSRWTEIAVDFVFRVAGLPLRALFWLISEPVSWGLNQMIEMQKSLLFRSGMYLPGVDEIIGRANQDDAFTRILTLGRLATALLDLYVKTALGVFAVPMTHKLQYDTRFRDAAVPEYIGAYFRNLVTRGELNEIAARAGFNARQVDVMIKARRELLSPEALRDSFLRGNLSDGAVTEKLSNYGFEGHEIELLKKLFYFIPPPQDLIRMGVREVFTPEIAQKFGQFQDLPPEFVSWAAKIGISDFWARAYWGAHWDLPSTTQGYEMLHRGVISDAELDLLLRALDVMPFWRERLKKISYNPFTRVDIRRMYKVGVLTVPEVKRAYMDIGYDAEKAEKLTQFTISLSTEVERDLTRADIVDGFGKRLFSRVEAEDLLRDMGYDETEITFYLERQSYKIADTKRKQLISNIKRRFERGIITQAEAAERLAAGGVTQAEIDEYLDTWIVTRGEEVYLPAVGDLKAWLAAGVIDETVFTQEMVAQGAAQKFINYHIELIRRKGAAE